MAMTKLDKRVRDDMKAQALAFLHSTIGPLEPRTPTVWTLQTHRAKSGMSRRFRVFAISRAGLNADQHSSRIVDITRHVSHAIGARFNADKGEMIIGGCGFDASQEIVRNLSYVMFGRLEGGAAFQLMHSRL